MRPLGLNIYRAITSVLSPLARVWLGYRVRSDKEDEDRLGEKLGKPGLDRPAGTLVWLHGASVGEAEIALNLVQTLGAVRNDLQFLLTSGTSSSASLIAKRLGKNARHQYLPLDIPGAVQRFLYHWQPDIGVFVESELWPNLILAARQKNIKLALVNARMNEHSLQRWKGAPASAAHLFGAFDWIGAADGKTMHGLQSFTSKNIAHTGNLKYAAPAPSVDDKALSGLQSAFGNRQIWLAISTHKNEDEVVLAAHRRVRDQYPDAALILVPRHPERATGIAALCVKTGQTCIRHSSGAMPDRQTSVYIGDSIGEMGLWLRLGSPAFIGGSLFSTMTGHNPLEAAKLGVPVLSGPYRASFYDVYKGLITAKGALETRTTAEIAKAVVKIFTEPEHAKAMAEAAQTCARDNAQTPVKITLVALLSLIGETS